MTAPALIFDLDGTLVDSVYQHVLAWHEALQEAGIELSVWRIHRRIGMSGGLFTRALLRETGRELDEALLARLRDRHAEAYRRRIAEVRPLPGARRLLSAPHRARLPLGDRHERTHGDRRARDRDAGRARRHAGGHPGSRAVCQAGPRPVPRGGAPARRRRRRRRGGRRQRLGHARGAARPHARRRAALRRLRHRRAGAGRARTGCTRIRRICSSIWTRSASAPIGWAPDRRENPAARPARHARVLPADQDRRPRRRGRGAAAGARRLGAEVRVLLPAYPGVVEQLGEVRRGCRRPGPVRRPGRLVHGRTGAGLEVLALEAAHLYDRPGNPYLGPDGRDWPDNHLRFAALSWVGSRIGLGALGDFAPDLVHAHDWQSGLAPAYLAFAGRPRPPTVMTIHNIAFPGLFPAALLGRASPAAGELHDRRARVLRSDQLPEGRAAVRRSPDHREPDLCARDQDRGAGHGAGRRAAPARGCALRHHERHRRRDLEPGERPAYRGDLRCQAAESQGAQQAGVAERASPWSHGPMRRCSA